MYKVNYDYLGNPVSIQKGEMSMRIGVETSEYKDFLAWNSKQTVPLDLKSTIEVPKAESRDLTKEIDELKSRLETAELKVEALEVEAIGVRYD